MSRRIEEFVLGSLSPEERAEIEEARRYDPELDKRIRNAEDALAPLSLAAGEIEPPAGMWNRIISAIDAEEMALDGRIIVALAEGDWQPVAPGIDSKMMWNNHTALLRCAPGAILPEHMHEGEEHLLVLSGDLVIGGRSFHAGDYIGSRRGLDRFPHMTRTGCLILSQISQQFSQPLHP